MNDIISLTEYAEKIKELEISLWKYQNQKYEFVSELWIETDFEKVLNKKRPLLIEKESYIAIQEEVKYLSDKILDCKAQLNYEKRLFNIYFAEKYNGAQIVL